MFSSAGNIIRMGADEISSQGRDATGVRVARFGDGETVSAVAPVLEAGRAARSRATVRRESNVRTAARGRADVTDVTSRRSETGCATPTSKS